MVRELLTTSGQLLHYGLRVGENDEETWRMTEDDLASIEPPLLRILDRYDVTRAAAAAGDEIALGAAVVKYGGRNFIRMRRLQAQRAAAAVEVPVSGVAAEPGTGPEHDAEHQRVHQIPDTPPRTRGTRV